MKIFRLIFTLIAGVLLLAACSEAEQSLPDLLPLDEEQPTFLFFYTDN